MERKIFGKASRKGARPVAASEAAWSEFVNATGYVTVAARKPDWEELKKQLPPGTPKLDESAIPLHYAMMGLAASARQTRRRLKGGKLYCEDCVTGIPVRVGNAER